MTTVSSYEPVLTYETSFDRKEGDKQKTYVKERDEDGDLTGTSVSRYIRIFDGDTIEELLFSILNFENKAKDMDMLDDHRVKQFQMTLGTAPRAVWNQLENTRAEGAFNEDQWDTAKEEFIQEYTEDTNARDTVLSAITTGEFLKPTEAAIKDHYTQIIELCSYIQMLPSDINEQPLSDDQKRNIFFNTFPKTWRADYRSSAHDINEATILQVKSYMALKKLEMDKAFKRKKQDKEQKEK